MGCVFKLFWFATFFFSFLTMDGNFHCKTAKVSKTKNKPKKKETKKKKNNSKKASDSKNKSKKKMNKKQTAKNKKANKQKKQNKKNNSDKKKSNISSNHNKKNATANKNNKQINKKQNTDMKDSINHKKNSSKTVNSSNQKKSSKNSNEKKRNDTLNSKKKEIDKVPRHEDGTPLTKDEIVQRRQERKESKKKKKEEAKKKKGQENHVKKEIDKVPRHEDGTPLTKDEIVQRRQERKESKKKKKEEAKKKKGQENHVKKEIDKVPRHEDGTPLTKDEIVQRRQERKESKKKKKEEAKKKKGQENHVKKEIDKVPRHEDGTPLTKDEIVQRRQERKESKKKKKEEAKKKKGQENHVKKEIDKVPRHEDGTPLTKDEIVQRRQERKESKKKKKEEAKKKKLAEIMPGQKKGNEFSDLNKPLSNFKSVSSKIPDNVTSIDNEKSKKNLVNQNLNNVQNFNEILKNQNSNLVKANDKQKTDKFLTEKGLQKKNFDNNLNKHDKNYPDLDKTSHLFKNEVEDYDTKEICISDSENEPSGCEKDFLNEGNHQHHEAQLTKDQKYYTNDIQDQNYEKIKKKNRNVSRRNKDDLPSLEHENELNDSENEENNQLNRDSFKALSMYDSRNLEDENLTEIENLETYYSNSRLKEGLNHNYSFENELLKSPKEENNSLNHANYLEKEINNQNYSTSQEDLYLSDDENQTSDSDEKSEENFQFQNSDIINSNLEKIGKNQPYISDYCSKNEGTNEDTISNENESIKSKNLCINETSNLNLNNISDECQKIVESNNDNDFQEESPYYKDYSKNFQKKVAEKIYQNDNLSSENEENSSELNKQNYENNKIKKKYNKNDVVKKRIINGYSKNKNKKGKGVKKYNNKKHLKQQRITKNKKNGTNLNNDEKISDYNYSEVKKKKINLFKKFKNWISGKNKFANKDTISGEENNQIKNKKEVNLIENNRKKSEIIFSNNRKLILSSKKNNSHFFKGYYSFLNYAYLSINFPVISDYSWEINSEVSFMLPNNIESSILINYILDCLPVFSSGVKIKFFKNKKFFVAFAPFVVLRLGALFLMCDIDSNMKFSIGVSMHPHVFVGGEVNLM